MKWKTMKVLSVIILSALLLTSCGGLQRTNESVVLSDNKTAENLFPIESYLNYLLYKQNVTVAIVTGRVARRNNYLDQDEEWKDTTRREMIDQAENYLHDLAKYYSAFSLKVVDRDSVNAVIVDYDTNSLPWVPKKVMDDLRKQTGATHVMLLKLTRVYDDRLHTRDETNRVLFDAATGKVEAVDIFEERNPISMR